jgi:uncharacterized protein (DUF362 family)
MKTHPPAGGINRRDFMVRGLKAGIAAAVAGSLGYWRYDPHGPSGVAPTAHAPVALPDFAPAGAGRRMSIVTSGDRGRAVQLALESLGGMEAFIERGDRVLIKVNAAFATPPMLSATTHPDLLAAVIRLCLRAGAESVVVTDNPINDPASCFALTGIAQAARAAGARVVLPRPGLFDMLTLPGGQLLRHWPFLYQAFKGINRLIGIAPVKDHHRSGASMSMKNWYGFLGGRRNIFHQDVHNLIKELGMLVKPTLVILDGVTAMVQNGPTGGSLSDLRQTNTLIVSTDQVAADACGARLLGKDPAELPYLAKAEAAGVGTVQFEKLQPIRIQAL